MTPNVSLIFANWFNHSHLCHCQTHSVHYIWACAVPKGICRGIRTWTKHRGFIKRLLKNWGLSFQNFVYLDLYFSFIQPSFLFTEESTRTSDLSSQFKMSHMLCTFKLDVLTNDLYQHTYTHEFVFLYLQKLCFDFH